MAKLTFIVSILAVCVPITSATLKNVLFIFVDDLRTNLGTYGSSFVHTPNIDQLADESLVFERAYVQQAVCGPSRNSIMSGRRPDVTQTWSFVNNFREVGEDWYSLPEYFKEHDYYSSGVGKIYHVETPPDYDPPSWSNPDEFIYNDPLMCPDQTVSCVLSNDPPGLNWFEDEATADIAKSRLRDYAENGQPFFLAVGFHKPHMPFRVPEEIMEFYPSVSDIEVAEHLEVPTGMPNISWHKAVFGFYSDLREPASNYHRDAPLDVELQRSMRHMYYAATTFMDIQVGAVLDELEDLGLNENTVVSLVSDHGWQLGEHNEWTKMTNFELATRIPMMIRAPGYPAGRTRALAEAVDLYPTLVELAGLPAPDRPQEDNLGGTSLVPLFTDPNNQLVKSAALSQYPRCNADENSEDNQCFTLTPDLFEYMGYSMRNNRWRYTEWVKWNGTSRSPIWDDKVGVELYDHEGDNGEDLDAYENVNVVDQFPNVAAVLSQELQEHFGN